MKEFLEIGKIVGTHGIRGEVRVEPWCDTPQFIRGFKTLYFAAGAEAVAVESVKIHKTMAILKLRGVATPEEADLLRGKILYMARKDAKLPQGRYFVQDLLGLRAIDEADPALCYGTVTDVFPTGANDVYEITDGAGKKTLIPAVAEIVPSVDLEGGVITGDFVNISSGSGTDKTTYSSKGIKAENDITISGGTVTVYAMDDGIHANSGEKLDNGSLSTGCVTISGGTLTVTSADDGIHSDAELTVSGGTVVIAEAHEGMEGNVVTISGGTVRINATDDGINAPKGGSKPLVSITGGYLEITTPSGDTDAIDSNGSFTMSGGFALIKGGAAMGGMAGSVDVDGSITVTGGTIIALGGICETPTSDSVCTFISGGTSFGKGSYTVTDAAGNTLFAFELAEAYSSCWIASDEFSVGGSYTIAAGGAEVVSWEQTSQSVGSAGSGRPGPGRPW